MCVASELSESPIGIEKGVLDEILGILHPAAESLREPINSVHVGTVEPVECFGAVPIGLQTLPAGPATLCAILHRIGEGVYGGSQTLSSVDVDKPRKRSHGRALVSAY